PPPQKGWGNDLCRLRERVNRTVDDALVSFPANTGLSEARAVRTLLEALPTGVELALANSLSVRLASWVWGVSGITVHPHTFRGVNGIDGSVAAAAGICSVSQKPTALLIGDVALAHDVGSLALVRSLKQPLIIIL